MTAEEMMPTDSGEIQGDFGNMDEDDEEVEWRSGPKLLPLVIAAAGALVIGASAGVGIAALLGSGLLSSPEEIPEPERAVADLETVVVNLRGEEGEQVLTVRVQVAVQTTDPDRLAVMEPALRDSVLVLASDHTADEILNASTRRRFREELEQRMDLLLPGDRVEDLYLTELVVK